MDVQPNDPAPQQETPTRVVDRVTEHTIRFETWVGYNSTWKYFKVRASCHVPCCSTPALLCSRQQLEAERSTYLRRATDAETQLAELNREMTNMMARYQKEIVRLRQAAGGYQKEKS